MESKNVKEIIDRLKNGIVKLKNLLSSSNSWNSEALLLKFVKYVYKIKVLLSSNKIGQVFFFFFSNLR